MNNNAPLVVHLIYRLDFGGLETLLVECINRMPENQYRHAIVCLTNYTDFANAIKKPAVQLFALGKTPGLDLGIHVKLWKLLRSLRPQILHTYNVATIEYAFTATLAGIPVRIHAEHGRDASDPEGKNRKHNLLRRFLTPLIDCYVPVSQDLQRWLEKTIRVPSAKNRLISNGVDTERFAPSAFGNLPPELADWAGKFVIGTVGRIQDVKNHHALVEAFIQLCERAPEKRAKLRLAIVGDGPLLSTIAEKVRQAGIADLVWLPGARTDISEIMKTFSVFALPSLAEGTPVTVLEAMATGLPVVATRVGGLPEVVIDNTTGILVPPADTDALANALSSYCRQPELAKLHGRAGRSLVEQRSSITSMVDGYKNLYDTLRFNKLKIRKSTKPCAE